MVSMGPLSVTSVSLVILIFRQGDDGVVSSDEERKPVCHAEFQLG
jgi:hypothetical protein